VALVDNITLIQNFGKYVLAGPEEVLLETFYASLGASWISSMVKTEYITNHPSTHLTDQAKLLHKHVLERLTIFLAEARRKQSDYSIEWLKQEGNFSVREVRDLKAKHILRQGKQEYAHYEVSLPFWVWRVTQLMSRRCMLLLPSNRIKLFYLSFQRQQSLMIGSKLVYPPVQATADLQYRFIVM
jgi:hypothetical protein